MASERKGFWHWFKTKWAYIGAKLNFMHETNADTRVQLEQTIQRIRAKFDAQHEQTIQMVGIRKKYESDLSKEFTKQKQLQSEFDNGLMMIDEATKAGRTDEVESLNRATQSTGQELTLTTERVEELKQSMFRATESAEMAKQARDEAEIELKGVFARRSKILNQMEEAKMAQLQADTMRAINSISSDDDIMSLEQIEDKVLTEYSLGSGAIEIESGGVEMQRREIRRRSRNNSTDALMEARRVELGIATAAPVTEIPAESTSES